MSLKQFEYLISVVECSSISKAADKLRISPQALRASINTLEKNLGFPFFHRSQNGVRLTDRGAAALDGVHRLIDIYRNLHNISEAGSKMQAVVRIAATATVLNTLMVPLIRRARKKYPNITIEPYEAKIGQFFTLMQEGGLGIIGSVARDAQPAFRTMFQNIGVELETLASNEFCVTINRRHWLAEEDTLTLSQLREFTLATYPKQIQSFFYADLYKSFSSEQPFYLPLQENILGLIASDPGVAALFPSFIRLQPSFPCSHLKNMAVSDYPMPANICLAIPEKRSPAEQLLLPMIRDIVSELLEEE